MQRRGVRVFLLTVLVAALASAAYLLIQHEQQRQTLELARAQTDAATARAIRLVGEIGSGLQAYVAPGQSETWWRTKVRADLEAARAEVAALRARLSSALALNDIDAAAAAVDSLEPIEDRVFELARANERSRGSAIVYTEGLDALRAARERLQSARTSELEGLLSSDTRRRALDAMALGGAAGVAILVALLLVPRGRVASAAPESATGVRPSDAPSDAAGDVEIVRAADSHRSPGRSPSDAAMAASGGATPARSSLASPAGVSAARTGAEPTSVDEAVRASAVEPPAADKAGAPVRDRRKAPELRAAADLCTDFARLLDSRELPGLLQRAAELLDAAGLIVWVADQAQQELRPTLAHGYPAHVIARLPAIPRNADNATAAAYRLGELEIVKTNGMSPGAIVVPLLTAAGCIGVVAAEVRHGRESSESARAIARILAAQLSTLLAITPAQESAAPQGQTAAG